MAHVRQDKGIKTGCTCFVEEVIQKLQDIYKKVVDETTLRAIDARKHEIPYFIIRDFREKVTNYRIGYKLTDFQNIYNITEAFAEILVDN